MENKDITLVFQGQWTKKTSANIGAARKALPGATVILSTLAGTADSVCRDGVDVLVVSEDPGELPPYKFGGAEPANNINRQIATAHAGLALVRTPYAVKIRTDCTLRSRAFVDAYLRLQVRDPGHDRIAASSFYTIHPDGIEGFPFHVSDWFHFGRTARLCEYWNVPLMTMDDAAWFERNRHNGGSNYFARLYRARFTAEQYLSVAYAKKRGYCVPDFISQTSVEIREGYEQFLAREFFIQSPDGLGLVFDKYAHLLESNYQFFNCVSDADWLAFCCRHGVLPSQSADSAGMPAVSPVLPNATNRAQAVRLMRRLDKALPLIKKMGLMPLVGRSLAFYR